MKKNSMTAITKLNHDLDREFKEILFTIRENVTSLDCNTSLTYCRLWLEKLSNSHTDKHLRNFHLVELCRQIQAGQLAPPFNKEPPEGHFWNMNSKHIDPDATGDYKKLSEVSEDTHNEQTYKESDDDSWSDVSSSAVSNNYLHPIIEEREIDVEVAKASKHKNPNEWKLVIAGLQLRLTEMIEQNTKLRNIVTGLESQLQHEKDYSLERYTLLQKEFHDKQQKHESEIDNIQSMYKEKLEELEKTFRCTSESLIKEFQEKVENTCLVDQKSCDIAQKNSDIEKLSSTILAQCLRAMNDISTIRAQVNNCSCEKKVNTLKRCVSRLDKLFRKFEIDHNTETDRLKHELNLKESALRSQLKLHKEMQEMTHKTDDFEGVVDLLEVKYIGMLETHEQEKMAVKRRDDKIISYLTGLLDKHGIVHDLSSLDVEELVEQTDIFP